MVHKVEAFTEVCEENSNVSATSVQCFQNSVHKEDKSLSCRTSRKSKLLTVQFVKHTGNQSFGRKSFRYCGYRRGQWDGSQVIFNGPWRCDKRLHKIFKNLYFASFQLQNWIALAPLHQQYVQGLTILLISKNDISLCLWPVTWEPWSETWELGPELFDLWPETRHFWPVSGPAVSGVTHMF